MIQTLTTFLREGRLNSAVACIPSTPHNSTTKKNTQLCPLLTFRGYHPPSRASPPPQEFPVPQCLLVHAEEAKPLGQNETPHNGSTKERCCCSDSICSWHSPCPIFQLQILSIHLATGNSQFFHEGLDAHSLVILNQLGE